MVKTTSKYIRIINGELKVLRLKKSTNSENLFSISQQFAYCKARVLSSISKLFVIRNVGSCRPCSLKITWRTLRLIGKNSFWSAILKSLQIIGKQPVKCIGYNGQNNIKIYSNHKWRTQSVKIEKINQLQYFTNWIRKSSI